MQSAIPVRFNLARQQDRNVMSRPGQIAQLRESVVGSRLPRAHLADDASRCAKRIVERKTGFRLYPTAPLVTTNTSTAADGILLQSCLVVGRTGCAKNVCR